MTMTHGYHDWNVPVWRMRDKHAGRGPIIVAAVMACMAFWTLTGFVISWIS